MDEAWKASWRMDRVMGGFEMFGLGGLVAMRKYGKRDEID